MLAQREALIRLVQAHECWLDEAVPDNPVLARIQATVQELVFLSEHDPLTKLYNRGALDRILSAELIRSARAGQSLALVLFDLVVIANPVAVMPVAVVVAKLHLLGVVGQWREPDAGCT